MYLLYLNPMQANAERCNLVAYAETEAALLAFVKREMVEPYTDGRWHKVFRKGGPLEWYNPPDGSNFFFQEIVRASLEDELERVRRSWDAMLISTIRV